MPCFEAGAARTGRRPRTAFPFKFGWSGVPIGPRVKAVRATAGDTCLPVMLGRIQKEWTYAAVCAAQEQFVADDNCARLVDTDDLTLQRAIRPTSTTPASTCSGSEWARSTRDSAAGKSPR
jgi:hypothetical protein